MLETKNGTIYEPFLLENRPLYDWLKRFQSSLDGSRAYEDIVDIYEAAEFHGQNKRHAG